MYDSKCFINFNFILFPFQVNIVDFKAIETILHLLARKCGLLNRVCHVDLLDSRAPTRRNSTLSVVEVTVQAQSPSLPSPKLHIPSIKKPITEADMKYINKALEQA